MAVAKQPSQAPWGEYVPGLGNMTVEQFAQLPDVDGWVFELHQGRVIRMPGPGGEHARIQARLIAALSVYITAHGLGNLYGTGCYILKMPDGSEAILCPDISYSLPLREQAAAYRVSYQELTPDFVAEIASPNDTHPEIKHKTADYLEADVRLIWNIFPKTQTVEVWRPAQRQQPMMLLQSIDHLDGLDVIPGFTCPVKALFG